VTHGILHEFIEPNFHATGAGFIQNFIYRPFYCCLLKGISNDNSTLACIQYFERGTAFTQGKNQFGPVHVHLIQCL
jgi:hypothetical protein